jgi:stearoyl-CoA desaturase (Delta-9 desaturase)
MKPNWPTLLFFVIYHVVLIIGLPFYFIYAQVNLSTVIWATVLFILTELAVTVGYHRYFAHKTFALNKWAERIVLFFATMAAQSTVFKWVHDHRIHHWHTDTDKDPYTVKKGFWHAHILWLFKKQEPLDENIIKDLIEDKVLKFQHKHFNFLMSGTNILAFIVVGFFTKDYLGAFMLAWLLRMFLSHHFTFFINSLAHTWGRKPYNKKISAVDSELMAFLTFGEGYHNYHHAFPNDYRNGGKWYQYDPGKWVIWILYKLDLAYNLIMVNKYIVKKKKVLEDKRILLEKINFSAKKEALEHLIQGLSDRITEKVNKISIMLKNKVSEKQLKSLKKSVRKDFVSWKRLSKMVVSMV